MLAVNASPVGVVMRRLALCAIAMGALTMVSGCASWLNGPKAPTLRLSPASLGHELSVLQRMEVMALGQSRAFDALLEVDEGEVRLAVLQLGQTVASLRWDGQQLSQNLAAGWPKVVSAESVLSDLQYVWWPRERVQAALPPGWTLLERANSRELRRGDNTVLTLRAVQPGVIELSHPGSGYVVRLRTQGAQPDFVSP